MVVTYSMLSFFRTTLMISAILQIVCGAMLYLTTPKSFDEGIQDLNGIDQNLADIFQSIQSSQ